MPLLLNLVWFRTFLWGLWLSLYQGGQAATNPQLQSRPEEHFTLEGSFGSSALIPKRLKGALFDVLILVHDQSTSAKLEVTGNSSRRRCDIPKMKIYPTTPIAPFVWETIKIIPPCKISNSHLERAEAELTRIGLIHEFFALSGLPIQKMRYFKMSVVNKDKRINAGPFLVAGFERMTYLRKRLNATKALPTTSYKRLDKPSLALHLFMQAFIGNQDWHWPNFQKSLRSNHSLQNYKFITLENGQILPVAYDFDDAALVKGEVKLPPFLQFSSFLANQNDLVRLQVYLLQLARIHLQSGEFERTKAQFLTLLETHLNSLGSTSIANRHIAKKHINSMKEVLQNNLYRQPLLKALQQNLYADKAMKKPICQFKKPWIIANIIKDYKSNAFVELIDATCASKYGWVAKKLLL